MPSKKFDMQSTLATLHRTTTRVLRELPYDLSARQMAIILNVYVTQGPHTVKSLANGLNISKAAVSRALNSLSGMGLVRRKSDSDDRRSVHIQRTVNGSVFLSDYAEIIAQEATNIDASEHTETIAS